MCQLEEMEKMAEENSLLDKCWQLRKRIPRWIKNRFYLIKHEIKNGVSKEVNPTFSDVSLDLRVGDVVKVKSREEILPTLDGWRKYKGCMFMDEMWQYCGGSYKVFKKVNYLLDERDMKIKKCKDTVILEGLICEGSWPFTECDRCCFFFWKEAWLEKIF